MRPLVFALCFMLFAGCQPGETQSDTSFTFVQPEHFPPATYDFERNPVTEAGFKLGKRLFEDVRLSSDNSVSCSTCHQQAVAFSDPQHRLSLGVEERVGTRNAPGLFNLAFTSEFMLDGGITHLDFVPINAITSEVEMDETLENVVAKLRANAGYREAFQDAFGEDTITSGLMLQALSQYQNMLVSDRSKYDDVVTGRNDAAFSAAELRGEAFFKNNCASCHAGVLFTDQSYRNNGLAGDGAQDAGRSLISEVGTDIGKFRVPSLRNVSRTAPYMHDGRFETLDEVLLHYRDGVVSSSTLDPGLEGGIAMTSDEMADVIAFLETLTDWEFVQDPRF
ncbi:c-type cytochrome [Neolewinella aurantiaca]|uniref:C-type cytochrome n=1 Tax=Neolewinella aurantiaca TaxID=2602767 RepID=A0A5C7FDT1_9BACT|nr:cytochrome c peroxidase [Neolewinella aurantiaca]TXF87668.1 c-type cytochrome [Neolewinella aurantiaca]